MDVSTVRHALSAATAIQHIHIQHKNNNAATAIVWYNTRLAFHGSHHASTSTCSVARHQLPDQQDAYALEERQLLLLMTPCRRSPPASRHYVHGCGTDRGTAVAQRHSCGTEGTNVNIPGPFLRHEARSSSL